MSYRPTIKTNSAGATSDFPLDADTVDGYHASAFAKVQSANNFLVDSNEFNFVSNGFTGEVWFNYKTVGGYNGNITEYKFGDGAGNLLGIAIHSGNVSNYVPTKTSDLQNDSGFITSSAIPSSLPANGGTSDYAMALYGEDYRFNDFTPNEYNGQTRIVTEFKDGYNIGYTGTQYSYGNLTTIVQWNDSSGGYPTQIFTSSNLGTIGIRYGTSDSTWSSWKAIVTEDMLSGYATKSWVSQQGYLTSVSWNDVTGKPTFSTVATSGDYNDLSNKPTIPSKTSDLYNDSGYITGISSTDVVNALGYTPANSSSIPTKTSDLTNDSGFITGINYSMVINALGYTPSSFKASDLLTYVYPVGSIYMSMVDTSPASFLGGTWARLPGRFLVGYGAVTDAVSAYKFFSAGNTDGEINHKLKESEMPIHTHKVYSNDSYSGDAIGLGNSNGKYMACHMGGSSGSYYTNTQYAQATQQALQSTGGDGSHNNLPPYLVVYMWKRTA